MIQENFSIRPTHYRIRIAPDLVRSDFTGTVHIRFFAGKKIRKIALNVMDLAIRRCACRVREAFVPCAFQIHPADEMLIVELPEPMGAEIDLQINYYGEINQSMAGFYRSQYTADGETHPIAVTQFQESDARRAFPCIDHPMYKASFEVTIIADTNLTVVSNTPVREQKRLENGHTQTTFSETPKMSTYLLFFGVGDFQTRKSTGDPRVQIVWLPGMADATNYGLAFGEKALSRCEAYFGIPYPLPKLDLIAVPDFAFGAMENWGAITFRENLLLYDPAITSAEAEERICEVVAHEIVHQWFGNLVTPSDWKYLWLNESFATYFGFGVVAHYHPDWQIWDEFLLSQTAPAMARDALTDTSAIELDGGSHVVINSSTAPIIYSKGGSVLRQIEGYLGSEVFQSGLNHYLNNHAYDCAASQDLWMALEVISGQPVSDIMRAWVSTPGHPLLTASRTKDTLRLKQKRFTYLSEASGAVWPIPLLIRVFDANGGSRLLTETMTASEMEISLGRDAAAYKINDQQTGFYRVAYADTENFQALCRLIRQKGVSEVDRWGIENDVYALVKAGHYPIEHYLQLLSDYADDDSSLVLSAIFSHLHEFFLITTPPAREKIAECARQWIAQTIKQLKIPPAADEPHGRLRLRSEAIRMGAFLEIPEIHTAGREQFARLAKGEKLHPDMRRPVMQAGACITGGEAYQWLTRQMETATNEQDRINMLTAMGCFKDTSQLHHALDYIMANTPDRNKFIPIVQMAQNPYAVSLMWDWYTRNHQNLNMIHPLIHERIIGAIVPVGGLDRQEEVGAFFDKRFKESHSAAPVIRMALEKLEINQRLRNA